jgi:urease accessory protein
MRASPPTVHPELLLMLLADARLPTSGHTQSGGLEPALLGGLDPAISTSTAAPGSRR